MQKEQAEQVFDTFARAGILLRVIDVSQEQSLLRLGIVKRQNEEQTRRISDVVKLFCSAQLALVHEV